MKSMKPKGQDAYETPEYIFNHYDRIFNFELDVASSHENTKCGHYFTEEDDSLKQSWNKRSWCNPPFSKKAEFVRKAHEEVDSGRCPICVMILPLNSISANYFHEYIEGRYHYQILKGRIAFINPDTGKPQKGNNTGTVVVFFMKKVEV